MNFLQPAKQTHAGKQSNEAKIVIAMQMRNEYMADFAPPDFIFCHLRLRAFAAINQEMKFIYGYYLRCWVAVECGKCRIVAKYGYS